MALYNAVAARFGAIEVELMTVEGTMAPCSVAPGQGGRMARSESAAKMDTRLIGMGRVQPNGARLSCGALVNDSFLNVRAPAASSAG